MSAPFPRGTPWDIGKSAHCACQLKSTFNVRLGRQLSQSDVIYLSYSKNFNRDSFTVFGVVGRTNYTCMISNWFLMLYARSTVPSCGKGAGDILITPLSRSASFRETPGATPPLAASTRSDHTNAPARTLSSVYQGRASGYARRFLPPWTVVPWTSTRCHACFDWTEFGVGGLSIWLVLCWAGRGLAAWMFFYSHSAQCAHLRQPPINPSYDQLNKGIK